MACTQRPGCQTVNPPEEPILRSPEGISCPQCSKVDLAVVERSQQRERIANARLAPATVAGVEDELVGNVLARQRLRRAAPPIRVPPLAQQGGRWGRREIGR